MADLLALYGTGSPVVALVVRVLVISWRGFAGVDRGESLGVWQGVLGKLEGPTLVATGAVADGCLRSLILGWCGFGGSVGVLGRERQVTLSTILQAAWAVVLSRLTGNRVVCVSGRRCRVGRRIWMGWSRWWVVYQYVAGGGGC